MSADPTRPDRARPGAPPARGWARQRLRLEEFLSSGVWSTELGSLPTFRRAGYKLARVLYLTVRGFVRDRCNSRAAALTYVTVLSIVPLLALAFSIAKGLNVYERLRYDVVEGFLDDTFGEDDPPGLRSPGEGDTAGEDGDADGGSTGVDGGAGEDPQDPPRDGAPLDGDLEPGGVQDGGPEGDPASGGDPGADGVDGETGEGTAEGTDPAAGEGVPRIEAGVDDMGTGDGGEADMAAAGPAGSDADGAAASAADEDQAGTVLRDAVDQVFEFVDKTDFRQLTVFGLLILFYTVIKLLSSIEATLNDIWGVHRARSWVRKVSDYISILVIVPLVLLAGVTGSASLNQDWMPEVVNEALIKSASVGMMCVGYTLLFLFLPNTRVRVPSALLGGIVAGVLTLVLQAAHVKFQIGVARYNAIYSTFAALPVFLVWLYLSWTIVLLGAEVAFAHQNEPNYIQLARARGFDHRLRERIAVRLQARVVRAFLDGERAPVTGDLALALGVPESVLNEVVEAQEESGLLALVDDGDDRDVRLVPGRDPARTRVQDVLEALKGTGDSADYSATRPEDEAADAVLLAYREEREQAPHNLDLATLARRWSAEGDATRASGRRGPAPEVRPFEPDAVRSAEGSALDSDD